jgi:hypothetical protein
VYILDREPTDVATLGIGLSPAVAQAVAPAVERVLRWAVDFQRADATGR